jgi:hypothetical protein
MPRKLSRGGGHSRPGLHGSINAGSEPEPELEPVDRTIDSKKEAKYDQANDLVKVNIVDVDYEKEEANRGHSGTVSIAEFVEDVCTICKEVEDKYGFQPSSVRNQRENILMLLANIWRCAPVVAAVCLALCVMLLVAAFSPPGGA